MKIAKSVGNMNEAELFNHMHNFNNFIGNLYETPFDKGFISRSKATLEFSDEKNLVNYMTEEEKILFNSLK